MILLPLILAAQVQTSTVVPVREFRQCLELASFYAERSQTCGIQLEASRERVQLLQEALMVAPPPEPAKLPEWLLPAGGVAVGFGLGVLIGCAVGGC